MNEDENINEEVLNYEEFELSKEQEEYLYKIEENTKVFNSNLPSFIKRFQEDAVKVSFKNDIPAALCCFVILGQICKDFVQIPNGRSIEDSRVLSVKYKLPVRANQPYGILSGRFQRNYLKR